jgi:hypothetical protein
VKLHQIAVIFASLVFLSVSQVFAEDNVPKKPGIAVDADSDGKVSYEEYRASKEKQTERQFKRMDVNGDGFIDATEKQMQKDKMRAMREKRQ